MIERETIVSVNPGGPAETAGLKAGDVIPIIDAAAASDNRTEGPTASQGKRIPLRDERQERELKACSRLKKRNRAKKFVVTPKASLLRLSVPAQAPSLTPSDERRPTRPTAILPLFSLPSGDNVLRLGTRDGRNSRRIGSIVLVKRRISSGSSVIAGCETRSSPISHSVCGPGPGRRYSCRSDAWNLACIRRSDRRAVAERGRQLLKDDPLERDEATAKTDVARKEQVPS